MATAQPELHVGDYGTIFRLTIEDDAGVVNISSASTKQVIFTKPDETMATKTASFYTDGTDGILQYTTLSADLLMDGPGFLIAEAKVVIGAGSWTSTKVKVKIYQTQTSGAAE